MVDVGSGAGFPGLALRIAVPGLRVTLVESIVKKAAFLRAVVSDLGLDSVDVVPKRAEEVARDPTYREAFDIATARALGSLPIVMELTLPFCRVGGVLIAPRGAGADREALAAAATAEQLGGGNPRVSRADVPGLPEQRSLVLVDKIGPTPLRYPRRTGIPEKRPLA